MSEYCRECKSEIKNLTLYKTSYYIFCTKECGRKFMSRDEKYYCSKCKATLPASQFKLTDKSNYTYLAKVCMACRNRKSKRLVIRFTDTSKTNISHTGYDNFEILDGILIISSKRDGKKYHYPMSNILVVDEYF